MVHDCISTPIQIDLSTEDSGLSHLRPQLLDLKVVEDDLLHFHGGGEAAGQSTV